MKPICYSMGIEEREGNNNNKEQNMNKNIEKLAQLVDKKCLRSFSIVDVDENGKEGQSKFCNSERLTLTFPNGETLVVNEVCSGSSENISLFLS